MAGLTNRSGPRAPVVIAALLWLILAASGFWVLARESFTPVPAGSESARFPADSPLLLDQSKPTLLLFLHPHCPCSQASLHELESLLAQTRGKVSAVVVFSIPPGVPPGWEQGPLWKAAARLPDARIFCDKDGKESLRFHVAGSGQTLLYDPTGHLVFSGGITPSRGQEGDNAGYSAIAGFVLDGHQTVARSPAFGCSLL